MDGQGKAFAVFKTEGRGWGVKAAEGIEAGEFVMEYVGEVMRTGHDIRT